MSLDKKTGVVSGTFNPFNDEHVLLFKEAKKHCDYLIVALQVNPEMESDHNSDSLNLAEIFLKIKNFENVDEVVPYVTENGLINIFQDFKVDVYIDFNENDEEDFLKRNFCLKHGIEVCFVPNRPTELNKKSMSAKLKTQKCTAVI
ncbi:glycerol-3-phosphate cytidylyltransferase [Flavobacterium flavipallidum]|uniref:Glycerol-3-phosphate cytidylyltransferase n=1 Tax=Flavobacterium flavipallidum TaxID=3139140 RepID=A0ABU9HMD8_9FLAO